MHVLNGLPFRQSQRGKNIIEGDGIERYESWTGILNHKISSLSLAVLSGQVRIKETFDPNDDIESYAEFSEGVTNIIIMGGNVWKKYRSFRAIKEALDTRRGSNSELETALKDLGDSVSFKGIWAMLRLLYTAGVIPTRTELKNISLILI